MKKKVIACLILCMAAGVAGCSNNTAKESETVTEAASESAAADETESSDVAEAPERPEYKALDYVTLGEYKGLEVTLSSLEPTEEEIEQEIQATLSQNDKLEEVKEGTVENGDVANIDYEGKLNGEAFDGGTDKGYDLTIGSGTFIEGFEEGLIGKEIGETVDLNLTFPENYQSADLAGKDVVFTVTVNSVKRMPELTNELAAEISDCDSVEAYRNSVAESLRINKELEQENNKTNDLVSMACSNATVNSYPQEMIDYQLDVVKDYYSSYAEQSGMEFADFLQQQMGVTEDEFNERMTQSIKTMLTTELVLRAIAETENVEVSDDEFQVKAEEYAAQSGMTDVDAFIKQYGKGEIMASILQEKAADILAENAVIKNPEAAPSAVGEVTETSEETASETTAETESDTADTEE